MIKPPKLNPGDTVGIVSPSWFGGDPFLDRFNRGVQCLEDMDYRVKVAPHALNNHGYVSDSAENRAADLQAMFADPDVKAVIASIGGDHSCQLLPLLDFDLIRRNPKIFMGFSDITVLNVAIWQKTGLVTFNGPAILTDFAEYPCMFDYTRDSFLQQLTQTDPGSPIQPSQEWTEEFLDWVSGEDKTRPRATRPNPGWSWLLPGRVEGRLVGGCLESLQHLRGTPYWPDFQDTILFLEISEEKPDPATVDGMLMDYENMGVLQQIKGLLFGRPYQYSPEERAQLMQILIERCQKFAFPVIADMDFGHTSPMMVLPIGINGIIDSNVHEFRLLEPAVI